MAKMYRIKDDEGKVYEVNEVEEEAVQDDVEEVETETTQTETVAPLTDEEITALRALLAERNAGGMEDDEDLEEAEDDEFEEENLEEEEIVDTTACDSKKKGIKDSANSKEVKVEDSIDDIDDRELKIAQEWAKRFK